MTPNRVNALPLFERVQGLSVALVQHVEQSPEGWIGERLEDVIHGVSVRDYLVACQVGAMEWSGGTC